MKKFFKAITFRGSYELLPTVIFFWYSFFFLVLVVIYGPFSVIDNWFIVNFSRPGFALFNGIESQFDKMMGLNMGLRSFFYASTLRSFGIIFALAVFCVFICNLAIIWFFHWTKAKRMSGNDPNIRS